MARSPLIRWLIFAGCFAVAYGLFALWRVRHWEETTAQEMAAKQTAAEEAQPTEILPTDKDEAPLEFTFTDQDGRPFDSASLKGQVWVGSFFFTSCPAVCWRLNQLLAALQEANPQSQVRFVSITCDPENDPPEVLSRYAERFHADPRRWTFLTGDLAAIIRLGKDKFKVSVEKGTHSDRAFVVDRSGQVRGRFRITEPDQFERLKKLLATLDAAGPLASEAIPAATNSPDTVLNTADSVTADAEATSAVPTPGESSTP